MPKSYCSAPAAVVIGRATSVSSCITLGMGWVAGANAPPGYCEAHEAAAKSNGTTIVNNEWDNDC